MTELRPALHVDVLPDGQVQVDAEGFQGATCLEATAQLTRRLQSAGICLDLTGAAGKPDLALESETLRRRLTQR